MKSSILNVVLLTGFAASSALASYSLQIGNIFWTGSPGGYDCFTDLVYPNHVEFTITKLTPGRQNYAVTAGPSATTGTYDRQLACGSNRLTYQLYVNDELRNVLKAPPMASPTEVISGWRAGNAGEVVPLSFVLVVPPNQVVEPGTYTDQIAISVYRSYDDRGAPLDTRLITITVVVVPSASLSIVPTGSGFTGTTTQHFNFGIMSEGQSLACDVLVRKNTSCDVMFTSANNGVLRPVAVPGDDFVPYTCTVNGSPISLATPFQMRLPTGPPPSVDGFRLPVRITIGKLDDAAAGDYRDEITVTLVIR